jgi:heme exporter protein A
VRLSIDNLVVKRGERSVLSGVNCVVEARQSLVLTGPNGAGKTTLIRAIAGFLPSASGAITLEGSDPELDLAQQSHLVGHTNGIKPSLTVAENVMFWASFLAGATGDAQQTKARAAAAIDAFGLDALADIEAAYLSAGQKRRVGLARLLVADRPLWLLDEPTVSLDTVSATQLVALINAHTTKGGLAVIATHLPLALERTRELALQPFLGGARV